MPVDKPLLIRGGGERRAIELNASGPLVAMDGDSEYRSVEEQFHPGDLLMIATDGITEARHKNHFFGLDGVARAVREVQDGSTVGETADAIVASALAFANGLQKDDICLLVIRGKSVTEGAG